MTLKVAIITALALCACGVAKGQDAPKTVNVNPVLQPPDRLMQSRIEPNLSVSAIGNQNAAAVSVTGLQVTPNVQVSGQLNANLQPKVMPVDGKVGVVIQHDVDGK